MFSDDLENFFDPEAFAETAVWTPGGGPATNVNGIFSNEYFDEIGGDIGVEGSKPRFTCAEADVANISQGDTIVIRTITYRVANVRPDGTGIVELILEG